MTSTVGPPPRASAWARGRRDFRRWRRRRPFWGGLLLILAGLELLYSSNLDLGGLRLHIGFEGFLSYLLPALLLLSGALVWLHHKQRFFYGIIGMLTALYSLVGLNLGGFFLGMLLGIVGGALAFAWTPVTPVQPRRALDDEEDWVDQAPGEDAGPDYHERWDVDAAPPGEYRSAFPGTPAYSGPPAYPQDRPTIPDQLDPPGQRLGTTVPTGHAPRPAEPAPAGSDEEEPPFRGGAFPGRTPRLFLLLVLPLLITVAAIVVMRSPGAALAQPCPSASTGGPPPAVPTESPPGPGPSATDDPSPAADPSGSPDPSPQPGGSSPAAPPATSAQSTPGCAGGRSPRPPQPAVKTVAVAPGQPTVSSQPAKLTADVLTLTGFAFAGVVDLPTRDGTIRALQFSMDRAVNANFRLLIDAGGHTQAITADPLTVQGNVQFYTSHFAGRLLGVPVEFTPGSPPPFVLPAMVFTDVSIDLVFIECDVLTGLPLGQSWPG